MIEHIAVSRDNMSLFYLCGSVSWLVDVVSEASGHIGNGLLGSA